MPVTTQLTRKQTWVFIEGAWADLIVVAGAFRGGKTAAAIIWLVAQMMEHPHTALVLRSKYQELDDIIRPELEKWLPEEELARPMKKQYPYDAHLKNGGRIMFRHLEKGMADLRGVSAGSILLDQAEDIPEDDFMYLFSRLSEPNSPRKMIITVNPNGHDYIWKLARKGSTTVLPPKMISFEDEEQEFVEEGGVYRKAIPVKLPDGSVEEAKVSLVEITGFENPHIPRDFLVRELAFFDEKTQRRLVYISWEESSALVFPDFDPEIHVVPADFPFPAGKWSGGMDHGVSAPTAFYLWNTFKRDGITEHVVGPEYYESATIQAHAYAINDLCKEFTPSAQPICLVTCDPSIFEPVREHKGRMYGDVEEYRRAGLQGRVSLRPSRTKRSHSKITALRELMNIDRTRNHLIHGNLGAPRIYIREDCPSFIVEIENFKTKNLAAGIIRGVLTEDKFQNSPTHALDANFYNAVMDPQPPVEVSSQTSKLDKLFGEPTGSARSAWVA
jgi:hypothetical protein